jgi:hypothetical protein
MLLDQNKQREKTFSFICHKIMVKHRKTSVHSNKYAANDYYHELIKGTFYVLYNEKLKFVHSCRVHSYRKSGMVTL